MIWQYGNYKFNCNFQIPTVSNFKNWLKDYLKLDNVNKYETWLASGFTQGWNTLDIDIVLTNLPKYKELQRHTDQVDPDVGIQDGKLITDWKHAKEVFPNLYSFTKVYPTDKQMNRVYKFKPTLLN